MQVYFGSHLPLLIAHKSCFVTKTRLSFFACQKDAAGAGADLEKAAPAPALGSGQKKSAPAPQHWLTQQENKFNQPISKNRFDR